MKEILKLTPQEGRNIIWEDVEEFELIQNKIVDSSRWSIIHDFIVKRNDGKFFKSSYRIGATEYQDEQPYEYAEYAEFVEVFPVEKTVIVYE